ncbi:MAG: ABC transporter permease, partial [Nitrososphaerales archaeon]
IPNGLKLGTGFSISSFLGVFFAFSLLAFGLCCVFTALAISVKSIDSLVAIVNFITFPLVFTSNAMFPLSSFPPWLKGIAEVNPITKADEIARLLIINGTSLTNNALWKIGWDALYLGVFALGLGILGYIIALRALKIE